MYVTDAAVAYIAFSIANPDLPKTRQVEALKSAFGEVVRLAKLKLNGQGFIEVVSHYDSIVKLAMRDFGFKDGGMLHSAFLPIGPGVHESMLIPE